jgi:trigger factor
MSLLPSEVAGEFEAIDVQVAVEEQGSCSRKLTLTIPAKVVTEIYDSVSGELSGQVRLPGFRPGKVPRGYAERIFKDQIHQRVVAEALGRAFQTAVQRENLDVVGEPKYGGEIVTEDEDGQPKLDLEKINLQRDKELEFEIEVEIKPTIELGNYKGLPVEQEEVEVFPEEVESELKTLASRQGDAVDAPDDAVVEGGDAVQGACRYLEGEEELKKVDEHYVMMGQGKVYGLHADIDESFLLGAKIGEKRTVECEIDKEFEDEALRGKKVTLDFEVKRIRRAQVPEIDDELAKKIGATDLASLKQRIEDHVREHLAEATNTKVRRELVDRVVTTTPFDLPERLLESYRENASLRQRAWLAQMGMPEEHLQEREAEIKESVKKSAEQELRTFFILEAIAKKEGLEPTDDDVDDEILSLARRRNVKAVELFDQLRESGQLDELRLELRTRKATEFLVDNAEIKVVPRKRPEAEKKDEASADAEKAAEEKPAEEKPAGEEGKPAAEEKSDTEEKPVAEEKPAAEDR